MQPEGESHHRKDPFLVNQQIGKLIQAFHSQFDRMVRAHLFFHLFFVCIGTLEIISLIVFFPFLNDNSLLSFALALVFLTAFSYFIVRLYCQARKPEQIKEIKKIFTEASKELIEYHHGVIDCHIALGDIYCRLSDSFLGNESTYYKPPRFFHWLAPTFEKLSSWIHWQDVFTLREMALIAAIEEQIQFVKCEATSLEAHTALANAYILLSGLYMNPCGSDEDERRWNPSKHFTDDLKLKFRVTAERAIEEFKILSNFTPNDPWVHEQLAYSYCDLQMPFEAMAEYEYILKLNPTDSEILYKLGVLYFRHGRNSQGLQIYEQLRRSHYKKAEMLIDHYGAYSWASESMLRKE